MSAKEKAMKRRGKSRKAAKAPNRLAWGGGTALAIVFAFVASNALWYQPHGHLRPLVVTRTPVAPTPSQPVQEARTPAAERPADISIQRVSLPDEIAVPRLTAPPTPGPVPPRAVGDPVVTEAQRIMAELGIYKGEIDGLTGPQTNEAISRYRKMVGLPEGTGVDSQLLSSLGARVDSARLQPPRPSLEQTAAVKPVPSAPVPTPAAPPASVSVERIQAGLRAFGNEKVDVDGRVGPNTSAAIREFQSLFGLPVTGQPDPDLFAKMTEIGLIQ
jgi:peptidoglycan hydrolase-like protein with peptidoglycan-binding domain